MTTEIFRSTIFNIACTETSEILLNAPKSSLFHEGKWISWSYFTRHLIELVLRTRLNNQADAYALYLLGTKDLWLSRDISSYLGAEYTHEDFSILDLKTLGINEQQIYKTTPFFSTEQLIGYLYYAMNCDGPVPNTVWNWYQQWYSDQYDPKIIQKATEVFGMNSVAGSLAHMELHVNAIKNVNGPEHYDDSLFTSLDHILQKHNNPRTIEKHLRRVIQLYGAYLIELEHYNEDNFNPADPSG